MLDDVDREAMREGCAISKSRGFRVNGPRKPRGVSRSDCKIKSKPLITYREGDHESYSKAVLDRKIAAALIAR